jgi:hypothetical protein
MDRVLPRLAIALALLTLPGGLAAQITPVGPETRADTITFDSLSCPQVAVGSDRSFEIVWDYNSLGDQSVHGRHYSASGEPTDPMQVKLVNGDFYDYDQVSSITASPGGFQVFYTVIDTQLEFPPRDFVRRLDLDGAPVGDVERFALDTRVLAGPEGTLYAAFYQAKAKNLFIQPVLPDGTARGKRIVLNTRSIDQPSPALAPLSGGGFAAVWSGVAAGKRPRQVIRGRIVRNGVPVGQDFDVNMTPLGLKSSYPSVFELRAAGAPSGGGFAVVWTVRESASNTSIHLRFFDANGRPRTPETVAVPSAPAFMTFSAALDGAGNLLLLWRPPIQTVLRARLFSATTGAPLGPAYQLDSLGAFACGDVAWAGDSWILAYRTPGDEGHGAIVWRRFTS